MRFLYFGCELFTCDLKNNFNKSQIFLHWTLCEIPQSTLRSSRTSKSPNTKITSKSVQIHSECETSGRFWGLCILATNSSFVISWKFSKSLGFFPCGTSVRSRKAPWNFSKISNFQEHRFRVGNDRNRPKLVSKRQFSRDFVIWLWIVHFWFHENFKKAMFRAWNGQNTLKWGAQVRFSRFLEFGYELFILDFMKFFKKSRIYLRQNLWEIPQSTLKILQNIKIQKHRFRARNDQKTLKWGARWRFLWFYSLATNYSFAISENV